MRIAKSLEATKLTSASVQARIREQTQAATDKRLRMETQDPSLERTGHVRQFASKVEYIASDRSTLTGQAMIIRGQTLTLQRASAALGSAMGVDTPQPLKAADKGLRSTPEEMETVIASLVQSTEVVNKATEYILGLLQALHMVRDTLARVDTTASEVSLSDESRLQFAKLLEDPGQLELTSKLIEEIEVVSSVSSLTLHPPAKE